MFTIADIRNIAIQIERNGEETYRNAAAAAPTQELAEMFTRMADDEKRHREWFEKIKTDKELTAEQMEMEAVGKSILQEMVKDKTFSLEDKKLGKVDSISDIITESQGFEEDTILFYEMLSGFIDDPQTREQLNYIIDEEKKHAIELKELLDGEVEKV